MSRWIAEQLRRLAICLITLFTVTSHAEPNYPEPKGFVTDAANLIEPSKRDALEAELKQLEADTSWEFWVVTVQSLEGEEKEDYAQAFAEKYKIGKKEKDNGILLLLARQERKVRIHTGYGAEGVVPDAIASRIIQETLAPKTKAGDWTGGIVDGAHEVIKRIREVHKNPELAKPDLIMGMETGTFILVCIVAFIICLLLLAFITGNGDVVVVIFSAILDGGGSGGSSGGGGGSFGGGGAGGDC